MKTWRYPMNVVVTCILSVSILLSLRIIDADLRHRQFFELYGNDVNTSGIWEQVRSLGADKDKLMDIAFQAHSNSWMCNNSETIREAFFETHTLMSDERKYRNIRIDLVKYSVIRWRNGVVTRGPSSYFYISKGMKPDCVYYCWQHGINTGIFALDEHVCNILMPKT